MAATTREGRPDLEGGAATLYLGLLPTAWHLPHLSSGLKFTRPPFPGVLKPFEPWGLPDSAFQLCLSLSLLQGTEHALLRSMAPCLPLIQLASPTITSTSCSSSISHLQALYVYSRSALSSGCPWLSSGTHTRSLTTHEAS